MSYRLDISFDLRDTRHGEKVKNNLIEKAKLCGCENYYTNNEISGHGRIIKRNHIVIVLFFPEDSKYIISFIRKIKSNRNIYIESIGFDNIKFTLLYASKSYLNMMQRDKMKEYLQNKQRFDNIEYKKVIEAI